MKIVKTFSRFPLLASLLLLLFSVAIASAGNLRLILMVDKSHYDQVSKAVHDAHGSVAFKYKYNDALAVSIPADQLASITARADVKMVLKDEVVTLPAPRVRYIPGHGTVSLSYTSTADQMTALSDADLQSMLSDRTTNYYPYENKLTHAYDFSAATNHYGEGVIVAIIDAGVSKTAIAVAGSNGNRIVGAENFTTDGIPADASTNGAHGTWVASCVGASAIFGFSPASSFYKAIKAYLPSAIIPNYFGPGLDGVPMIGQAPLVKFYALKVFPQGSNSTSRSIIAAALERAIELKEDFDNGNGGVNIQVANMSIGGPNLFAGNDPFYGPLVIKAHDVNLLLTVSAGNDGPAGLTVGTPGDSKGILSVGATSDAIHTRIIADLQIGPGFGAYYRPVDNNIMADFSSRGPTADGRMDPNIVAPGDWRFAQGANGGISLVSGTSFSAPTVAGAAALLFSAHPSATDEQIRGALLNGANPKLLDDHPRKPDQGFGFLDVLSAGSHFGSFNPPDVGPGDRSVADNIEPFGIKVIDDNQFGGNTGWLVPGERKEYYFEISRKPLSGVTIQISVTPELPLAKQNQLFGDDAEITITTGKTSFGDYRAYEFLAGSKTYVLNEDDLDKGLMRIGVTGDYTNVGRVRASVQFIKNKSHIEFEDLVQGTLKQGDVKSYPLVIPAGLSNVHFRLDWPNGWQMWPTNDLDILFADPDGNLVLTDNDGDGDIDGAGIDAPERVTLSNPAAGQWTMIVLGSTVWQSSTNFEISSDLHHLANLSRNSSTIAAQATAAEIPASFALEQNSPNPFNPSTVIRYSLPVDVNVRLAVYNTLGQQVATLVDEAQQAGVHQVVFQDPKLSSGVYIYRIEAGNFTATRKFVLVK